LTLEPAWRLPEASVRSVTISAVGPSALAHSSNAYLLAPILLLFVLLVIAVLRSPSLVASAGIGSAIIVTAPLILATYALMAVAVAGRGTVDLSVGPLLGFINVTLVQLFGAGAVTSPLGFFVYAIAVGIAYHIVIGSIIVFVRIQPIIVALSGYLALSGINLVILSRPGGTVPEWMMSWGAGTSIFSPVLVILLLATAGWLLFTRSAFYGHLRLMGADERAAYTSGVRINIVRLGAHCIAGVFCGLAALTFTSLISSGDPTQGTTYTLVAVTALVLGGTSLAGGRGGVFGSLLGAVNLFLVGYVLSTFSFGAVQGFVTDLAYGVILVLSLLLTVAIPYLQARIRRISPFLVFVVLSLLFLGVVLHSVFNYDQARDTAATKAAPSAAANAASSPLPAKDVSGLRPSAGFVFEGVEAGLAIATPVYAKPLMVAALLLVAFVIILRVTVAEIGRNRMTPVLYGVIVSAILLGLYLLPDYMQPTQGQTTSRSAK
jgi:ribose transport system permease protein